MLHSVDGSGKLADRRLRVLVAEDNVINQRLVMRILERRGHRVHVVGTGQAALDALAAASFDLVLMDVQMPDMDGLEATRAIRDRERNGKAQRLPVLAITAHTMKGDREKCLAAGMDDVINKPIDSARLIEMVEAFAVPPEPPAVQDADPLGKAGRADDTTGDPIPCADESAPMERVSSGD
jgi:CheY-like chemotaxis protein